MRILPTDVRGAVEHLPEASVLVMDGVAWEAYERIGADLADRPGGSPTIRVDWRS